jgi:DNA-binding transcriptional ArsR family regulator
VREVEAQERVFHALAHPSRRQVLLVLHARGDRMRASEIATRFACSWPTTSRHLKVLQEAGLVTVSQEGRERFYTLETGRLETVVGRWLDAFRG